MKKVTILGSGVELEVNTNNPPEIESIINVVSKYYDNIIFGGTKIGIVGIFAKKAKEHGIRVTSVMPKMFFERHRNLVFTGDDLILTDSLAERKKILTDTDLILIYPGGVGTIDELFDVIVRIMLEEIKPIPIIIYNFERFYSPILLQIVHGIRTGTIKNEIMNFIYTFEYIDQFDKILRNLNDKKA